MCAFVAGLSARVAHDVRFYLHSWQIEGRTRIRYKKGAAGRLTEHICILDRAGKNQLANSGT